MLCRFPCTLRFIVCVVPIRENGCSAILAALAAFRCRILAQIRDGRRFTRSAASRPWNLKQTPAPGGLIVGDQARFAPRRDIQWQCALEIRPVWWPSSFLFIWKSWKLVPYCEGYPSLFNQYLQSVSHILSFSWERDQSISPLLTFRFILFWLQK